MTQTSSNAPVRRRHSREEIDRIVAAYERGEGTQREIANRQGVCLGTLRNWLRRQRQPRQQDAGADWLEVVPDLGNPGGCYRIEVGPGRVLVLGPGWRPAEVRELVALLSPS